MAEVYAGVTMKRISGIMLLVLCLAVLAVPTYATTTAHLDVHDGSGNEITGNPLVIAVGEQWHYVSADINKDPQYKVELYLETSYHAGDFTLNSGWTVSADSGVTYSCTQPNAYAYSCTKTGGPGGAGITGIEVSATLNGEYNNTASARIRGLPSGGTQSTDSHSWIGKS